MKIEVNKERISSAVSKAEKITSKNSSLPVLSCVILEARNNSLYISSTNLDISIEIEISAKVSEEGTLAIPGSILAQYLSNLNKTESVLNLHDQNKNLYITSKNTESVILTTPYEDFPTITKTKQENSFKIKAQDLIEGFKSVWYSASISNIKPELSSVYIYPEGEDICFVATDSFRLAEKKIKIGKTEGFEPILIPYKNVTEIARVIEDVTENVELTFNEDLIIVKASGLYLVSRIVDGVFPDYKQIIPKDEKTTVSLLKEDFVQATKISSIFSDNYNKAEIVVSPKDGVFEISTKNKDKGETINRIKTSAEGDAIRIGFNFKYINDCLSSIKSDTLKFIFNGPEKPLIITGGKDGSFRYLVMPMVNPAK